MSQLSLRFAARSDVGLIRDGNEDSGYAGPQLLAVADGMGGHAAGEVASSVVVATLAELDEDVPGPDLLDALDSAIQTAHGHLRQMVEADDQLEGMGTTVTALLWSGGRLGLAHIGDSRAYLLRDGELQQITHDHTFVQSLVDEGRITAAEAEHHPQRSLMLRALDGRTEPDPDLSVRDVRLGDRYLLCSDGLSGVVSEDTLAEVLARGTPDAAVAQLVELALRGGGPDNITCIVADIVELDGSKGDRPVVVGAASDRHEGDTKEHDSAAGRAARLREDGSGRARKLLPARIRADRDDDQPRRRRWVAPLFLFALFVVVFGGGAYAGYWWTQQQYYVGDDAGNVAIYRGVDQTVIGRSLSSVVEGTSLAVADLPAYQRERVEESISAPDLQSAQDIVSRLTQEAERCAPQPVTPSPTAPAGDPALALPTPSTTPLPTPGSTPGAPTVGPTSSPATTVPPGCEGPTS